ncbi:hypothetical protein Tco_0468520 [Tanacetum coccineum]
MMHYGPPHQHTKHPSVNSLQACYGKGNAIFPIDLEHKAPSDHFAEMLLGLKASKLRSLITGWESPGKFNSNELHNFVIMPMRTLWIYKPKQRGSMTPRKNRVSTLVIESSLLIPVYCPRMARNVKPQFCHSSRVSPSSASLGNPIS